MRKIVCLLLGVLVFLPSYAQDTITEGDTCYSFWPHSQPLRERGTLYSDYTATPIIFEEIFTESKWVYGISVRRHYPLDSSYVVFLAKMGKDSIVSFLDTVYLDSLAVRTYLRLKIHPRIDTYTWDYNTVVDHVYQCHEIYFRRPWLMQDTFYVFFKRLFDLYTTPDPPQMLCTCLDRSPGETIPPQRMCIYSDSCNQLDPYSPVSFLFVDNSARWGYEIPILEPNGGQCHKPTGLRLAE